MDFRLSKQIFSNSHFHCFRCHCSREVPNCSHAFPSVRTLWKGQPEQPEVGGRAVHQRVGMQLWHKGTRTKNRRKNTDFR